MSDRLRSIARGDDPRAAAEAIAELANAGDTSPETLAVIVDALTSYATWREENPYYDGLSPRELQYDLASAASDALARLGEPAIDAVLARIEERRVLIPAARLGPRIVEAAKEFIRRGRAQQAEAAQVVLAQHLDAITPDEMAELFMRAFDLHVDEPHRTYDFLVRAWPRLPAAREQINARWFDGSLGGWIESRADRQGFRVRHLVALLAVVLEPEALPLMIRILVGCDSLHYAFEPLLVIETDRARGVIEASPELRAWAEPIALQIAKGASRWTTPGDQRDYGLVAALTSNAEVYERLIAKIEHDVKVGTDVVTLAFEALAAHVRHDMTRFDRALAAAHAYREANRKWPGKPAPHHAVAVIEALKR